MIHTGPDAIKRAASYVLYIEFADDPPRVGVFDTLDEAETQLDVFEVTTFDPPQNDALREQPYRARIFECKDVGWGTEVDIGIFLRAGRWRNERCWDIRGVVTSSAKTR